MSLAMTQTGRPPMCPTTVTTASAGSLPSTRSEEHTSELQSQSNLVCRLLLEKKNSASLHYPDELFDFYVEHNITSVAFNVEEIAGPHVTSSLSGSDVQPPFRRFYSRFTALTL